MKRVNLGCGKDYRKGWVNVDIDKKMKADQYFDLNKYPYPFKKGEVDFVMASHVVEHLDDPIKFFKEMERILSSKGEVCVIVPHFTNPMAYDPTHKTYYGYKSLKHVLDKLKIRESKLIFTPKYKFMEWFAASHPVFYENTPLRMFPCKEIRSILVKK